MIMSADQKTKKKTLTQRMIQELILFDRFLMDFARSRSVYTAGAACKYAVTSDSVGKLVPKEFLLLLPDTAIGSTVIRFASTSINSRFNAKSKRYGSREIGENYGTTVCVRTIYA